MMDISYELEGRVNYIRKEQLKRIILYILIIMSILQQMPIIKDLYYNQIREVLYFIFGIFSIISFVSIKKFMEFNFIKYYFFLILYSLVLYILIEAIGTITFNLFELLNPFGILLCSLNTNYTIKQIRIMTIWYSILAAILGVGLIFYYGEGLTITKMYFLAGKNQIGPMLGVSAVIMGFYLTNKRQYNIRFKQWAITILIFIILMCSVVIIRNRAGLIAIVITLLISMLVENKFKRNIRSLLVAQGITLVIFTLFLSGTLDGLINIVWKSLTFNYDIYNINSISAGRTDTYLISLQFIKLNPIFGELGVGQLIYTPPHNYILNKLVSFGLLGSLPFISFYLYLWLFIIKEIFIKRVNNYFTLPLWTMFFTLIVSIFEFTYPYGPGVSQLMIWLLLGQYLKLRY